MDLGADIASIWRYLQARIPLKPCSRQRLSICSGSMSRMGDVDALMSHVAYRCRPRRSGSYIASLTEANLCPE
jgi:hypothetical protein